MTKATNKMPGSLIVELLLAAMLYAPLAAANEAGDVQDEPGEPAADLTVADPAHSDSGEEIRDKAESAETADDKQVGDEVSLADAVTVAIENVQRGSSLARSLAECPELFPPSVIEMISVAEESGRLDKELVRLAGSYEQHLDRHLKMMVAMAEPALLFVMAVLVGTVVIGMLLPIFNLQELIQ